MQYSYRFQFGGAATPRRPIGVRHSLATETVMVHLGPRGARFGQMRLTCASAKR